MTKRRLIVMRHSKAEPYASTDHARELTTDGRDDARDAGRYLGSIDAVPDHAVVSDATRTRETWDEVSAASGSKATAHFDEQAYAGGVSEVLEVLRAVPEDAETVVFIGHNPAASYLVHAVDDGHGDPDAVTAMLRGFPASALAVFDVDDPWRELGDGTGRLTHFHVGRG